MLAASKFARPGLYLCLHCETQRRGVFAIWARKNTPGSPVRCAIDCGLADGCSILCCAHLLHASTKVNVFLYETYEAGKIYGTDSFPVTCEVIRAWLDIYGGAWPTTSVPVGLVVLMQQQAFKRIITPRAPGHIQGRQRFTLSSPFPVDSVVYTEVSCISKAIRKERRWVDMGFTGRTSDGAELYSGINTVLVPC